MKRTRIMNHVSQSFLHFWDNPALMQNSSEQIEIIHLHLFTESYQAIVFQRASGIWSPISGTVEFEESYISTATREAAEEVGLKLEADQIVVSEHNFRGESPKGKKISGITCFAVLPDSINWLFRFNGELIKYRVLSLEGALDLLSKEGMPEAVEGFSFLVST